MERDVIIRGLTRLLEETPEPGVDVARGDLRYFCSAKVLDLLRDGQLLAISRTAAKEILRELKEGT